MGKQEGQSGAGPPPIERSQDMAEVIDTVLRCLFGESSEAQQNNRPAAYQSGLMSPTGRQSRRNERLLNEIYMISPRFSDAGGIYYDEENYDWILIPRYALPERWQERWTKLMIVPPPTYPLTPPIGFYLNQKFHLKGGGADPHATGHAYHGAPDLIRNGWYWYCVTITNGAGGWQPSADYRQPDNLWTFLNMVRESLTNDV
jgi:hypothetical protein